MAGEMAQTTSGVDIGVVLKAVEEHMSASRFLELDTHFQYDDSTEA